jgi:hypothetical protein
MASEIIIRVLSGRQLMTPRYPGYRELNNWPNLTGNSKNKT